MTTQTVSKKTSQRRLQLETLESRLNLSTLGSAASLITPQPAYAAAAKSRMQPLRRLSVNIAPAVPQVASSMKVAAAGQATTTAGTDGLFGDTAVNTWSTSSVPIYDYSAISGASVQWGATPVIGNMANSGVSIEYKLNAASAGNYNLTFGVGTNQSFGSFDLYVNGSKQAMYDFLGTGGWSNFTKASRSVALGAGTNTIRIVPTWGTQFNISSITVGSGSAVTTTTPATTTTTPATTTTTSSGSSVYVNGSATVSGDKATNLVNCKLQWDNGQPNIGGLGMNGYAEYTLNVQNAGTYNFALNAASPYWGTFDLVVNGSVAGNAVVNPTGGWSNFVNSYASAYLPAGTVTLRLQSKWGSVYNLGTMSISSGSTAVTTPTPAPAAPSAPAAAFTGGAVSIANQWMTSFNQLNVTGTTGNDSISVSQSGNTLYITANGQTSSYTASNYGNLVIKGGDGNDTITVDSSVSLTTLVYGGGGSDSLNNKASTGTIVAVGGGWDTLNGNWNTSYWADSSDSVGASGANVHKVSSFYGGVSTELFGQDLQDPAGTWSTTRLSNNSLWGTGPSMSDVNQGQSSDCYLLADAQTLANVSPSRLRELAVDLGDGTYAVQFTRNGSTEYVRVDGDLPAGGPYANGLNYAHPGASGNIWMPIIEKAYAIWRTGAWNYSSISWGSISGTLSDLGLSSTAVYGGDANTLYNNIASSLWSGKGVTYGTRAGASGLIGAHAYTVVSAWSDAWGGKYVQLKNPWGFDGTGWDSNTSDGLITVSADQLLSNMQAISAFS